MNEHVHLEMTHPLNVGVLHYLRGPAGSVAATPVCAAADHPDPYFGTGSHPDVVEHLWQHLASGAAEGCLVYGTPALVHARAGVVLAIGMGTAYAIRVPEHVQEAAAAAGCHVSRTWSDGSVTDLGDTIGPDWMFGAYAKGEAAWLAASCADEH